MGRVDAGGDGVRLGRLWLAGPGAWPDVLLDGDGLGAVLSAGRYALGVEVGTAGPNPVVNLYLGWWAFEFYLDRDGTFAEDEEEVER